MNWELVLAADHVHSALRDLADEHWMSALPLLLEDFQQLLRDALDLLRELGEADDRNDRSHWDIPSITPHWQNRGFRDWVSLIELLRDAWLAVRTNDSARATRIAQSWFEFPYPTFKRLALFAASQDGCVPSEQWVDWLLTDGAWWLWSTDTGREVFRLFVLQGRHLAGATQERLEAAIMAGPPREMYRDDLEADLWQELVAGVGGTFRLAASGQAEHIGLRAGGARSGTLSRNIYRLPAMAVGDQRARRVLALDEWHW